MSREKIKDRKISKESILFHNELPNEIVNKIKLLIDNANSGNEKFNLAKDIYKEQIDNVIRLINDGYKIDVFLDDENDLSSYVFVGYISRENLSDKQEESDGQKKEFYNSINQLSYSSDDSIKYKTVDELFTVLRNCLVKNDIGYNKKNISLLPVIIINQYKVYNSMLQTNSNMLGYFYDNENNFVNNEYLKNDENIYIFFIDYVDMMIKKFVNDGKSRWDFDNQNEYIDVSSFEIKNVNMTLFDSNIPFNYISFDILYTIVMKAKQFYLYIPIYVNRNVNNMNEREEIIQKNNMYENVQNQIKTYDDNKNNENNKNKYELGIYNYTYFDEESNSENRENNNHINVYNKKIWRDEDKDLRLNKDFCKTSFAVYRINEINVGILEIKFCIRFISPNTVAHCFNSFDDDSQKEILNIVDKYNSEKEPKIELFNDLKYNHFLAIYNYYGIDWNNKDEKYLRKIKFKLQDEAVCDLDITPVEYHSWYLGKKSGLFVGSFNEYEYEFYFSLLKYFIINNLSNSLIGELINMKNSNIFNIDCEKTLLNLDKEYLEFSMLSSRDLYSSNIDYNKIEEYDKKFHIEDIDTQYKKNLNMYKEIVDIESKKQGNSLANKLNTIQIMSILLTIIGWGLVIAQTNILNKTLNYFIIIIFAAISGLLAAIFINNFISKK